MKYKNIPLLLKAFKKISLENKIISLILIGSGPESEKINNLISKLNLCERVYIISDCDDNTKKYFYKKAEFLILPSTTPAEAFGFVQLEAMSQSLPVISFDISKSGVSEINKNNITGYCLKIPKSYEQKINTLYLAMRNLLNNKKKKKSFH